MPDTPRKKLLIVDDEANLRTLYEAEFANAGYDVTLAASGPEAIDLVQKVKPDLVILDIRMPGMDGIETMSEILSRNNQIPIIINSAYSHYKENFMSWSADAYVVKSSDLTELKSKVAGLLTR
ncbi:MAG: response regulator [Myxococcales bacterium]|nr:MAG: response regulator [Myxococcales bacterium]